MSGPTSNLSVQIYDLKGNLILEQPINNSATATNM